MPDLYMDVDAALSEVPVNLLPLLDDTDFKSIEGAVAYNAAGMALRWHFITPAGAYTVTSVTPTTGGNYDWTDQGDSGIYTIEIPASGGASINNDTEGFGWFTGVATGVLPWRGPVIGFRAAGLNDALIESAYSATRGLAGTALPNAAADAAGGLPISDAGGLDLDAIPLNTELEAALDGHEGPNLPTGVVATDGGNGAAAFKTDRTESTNDYWKDALLLITSGALAGQIKKVSAYNGSTKVITVVGGFTATPADGVAFALVNR